ncbi:MAG: ABC transporter substrate-binding protein [Clostridium sp.]|nr:MAG: ABC transporter substrate-binding protein [Clostridium sp.]
MKQNKKLLALLLVLVIAFTSLTLVACNQGGDKNGGQGDAGVSQEVKNPGDIVKNADGTVTFMDMNNVVHKNIKTGKQRIINMWPANTSTFFGIGAGDKLLATSIQQAPWVEVFYPAIKTRGEDFVLKGGTGATAENLVNRNPDLVIVHPSNGRDLQKQLLAVGVDSIFINFSDFESMKKCYKIVGALLGGEYETKLNLWCTRVDETKARIKAKTDLLTKRPVVLYCTGIGANKDNAEVTEFSTMAANSIFQDWCEIAGGKYFMAEHPDIQGMAINREYVLENWPDIILCAGANQNKTYDTLKNDPVYAEKLAGTTIVRNPYVLFDIARFGFEALLQMSQAVSVIQPEIAAELGIDMKKEIKEFYSTFAGVTLTNEQVQLIIDGKKPDGTPI